MKKTKTRRPSNKETVSTLSASHIQKIRGGIITEDVVVFGHDETTSAIITDDIIGF